jgi:hypothetical protein
MLCFLLPCSFLYEGYDWLQFDFIFITLHSLNYNLEIVKIWIKRNQTNIWMPFFNSFWLFNIPSVKMLQQKYKRISS